MIQYQDKFYDTDNKSCSNHPKFLALGQKFDTNKRKFETRTNDSDVKFRKPCICMLVQAILNIISNHVCYETCKTYSDVFKAQTIYTLFYFNEKKFGFTSDDLQQVLNRFESNECHLKYCVEKVNNLTSLQSLNNIFQRETKLTEQN